MFNGLVMMKCTWLSDQTKKEHFIFKDTLYIKRSNLSTSVTNYNLSFDEKIITW